MRTCECDLRDRRWDPYTGKCQTCGAMGVPLSEIAPPPARRWPISDFIRYALQPPVSRMFIRCLDWTAASGVVERGFRQEMQQHHEDFKWAMQFCRLTQRELKADVPGWVGLQQVPQIPAMWGEEVLES